MKKNKKTIAFLFLITIAIIGNTSIFFQHDLDNDISLGSFVNLALADGEGEVEYAKEYCARCYTEYGQLGVWWGCEYDYTTCSFVPCLYGYC